MYVVSGTTQAQIPEAIKERRRREAEKKQRKDELLALTEFSSEQQQPSIPTGQDKLSDVTLAIEDERRPEPPTEDQYTVLHPYAAPLDM